MPQAMPTVLVVEDEPLIRLDLVDQVNGAGFQVIEACTAPEALEILENRQDIGAVLTDIRMPGEFDGLELAHLVRRRWPPITVVICSANELSEVTLPPDTLYVPKPCSGTDLDRLFGHLFPK